MFQSERKGRVAQIVRPVHGEVVGGGALREERERDVRGADQKAPANEGACPQLPVRHLGAEVGEVASTRLTAVTVRTLV